jgi:hypothetical protein
MKRRLLTVLLTCGAALASMVMPAVAQGVPVADVEITDAAITVTGAVRIVGSYTCEAGYDPEWMARGQAWSAWTGEVEVDFAVTCDGSYRDLSVKVVPPGDRRFLRRRPVSVSLSLWSHRGRSVNADNTLSMTAGSILADTHISRASLTRSGDVRLRGSYVCPLGYTVDSTYAPLKQLDGTGFVFQARDFKKHVTCDGDWNEITLRVPGEQAGQMIQPDLVTNVRFLFEADNAEGLRVGPDSRKTVIIAGPQPRDLTPPT